MEGPAVSCYLCEVEQPVANPPCAVQSPGGAVVAAAGSLCNGSPVALQAWKNDKDVEYRIKVVHEVKGQWQERHEGEHFAELFNSADPKQRDRALREAAQLLMYMVGVPNGSIVRLNDAFMPWQHSSQRRSMLTSLILQRMPCRCQVASGLLPHLAVLRLNVFGGQALQLKLRRGWQLPCRSWKAPGTASSAAGSGTSLLHRWGALRAEQSGSPRRLPATTPTSPSGHCTSTCCTWHTQSRGWTLSSNKSPPVTGGGFSSAGPRCTPLLQQQPLHPQRLRQVTTQDTRIACFTPRPSSLWDPREDVCVLASG